MAKLTLKQKRFCDEYLQDLNATRAYQKVYKVAVKSAEAASSLLLRNIKVKEYLAEKGQKIADKLEITAERVLQELAKLAFHDPGKFFDDDGRLKPISELDDTTRMSIAGIDTFTKIIGDEKDGCAIVQKIKMADKGQNLERLGRHLKLFTDVTEVKGSFEEWLKGLKEKS